MSKYSRMRDWLLSVCFEVGIPIQEQCHSVKTLCVLNAFMKNLQYVPLPNLIDCINTSKVSCNIEDPNPEEKTHHKTLSITSRTRPT